MKSQYTYNDTSKDYKISISDFVYCVYNSSTNKKSHQLWIDNKHFANLYKNKYYNSSKSNSAIYKICPISQVTKRVMKSIGIVLIRFNNSGKKFFLIPAIPPYFSTTFFCHLINQDNNTFLFSDKKVIVNLSYKVNQTKNTRLKTLQIRTRKENK